MAKYGPLIRTVGSSARPVTAIGQHNFERVYARSLNTTGTDARYHYGDLTMKKTGGGEYLRVRGIADGTNVATAGTVNAIHATGRVASGATVSGALNAIRATLEVAGTTPTPGGTLAALQLDSNIVTGATMGANDAFIRVTDSGATALANFINFAAAAGCVAANTGATPANTAGYINIRIAGTTYKLAYFPA